MKLIRTLSRMPIAVYLAAGFMALMLFLMVFAKFLQPYPFDHIDLLNRIAPPLPLSGSTWLHPAGTDKLGRDLLSRLLIGLQTSMLLAVLGTLIGAVLGFLAAHQT